MKKRIFDIIIVSTIIILLFFVEYEKVVDVET